jgi:4-hydroxy-tetrahydrodipicolinate synthase
LAAKLTLDRLRSPQLIPMTAYDEHGELNLAPMRTLTQRVFDAGMRVFVPCAGSAEFQSLSAEEILATVEMTKEVIGDEGVVLCPVGQQLRWTLDLGRDAATAGADGVLIMPLAFPYLSNVGAEDYYRAVLDTLEIPVLIYKKSEIPSDELLLRLAEHPNMLGVKHAVNDVNAFRQVVTADRGRIGWFCGSAERFAPFYMLAGADGYTTGAGNLCPRVTLAMYDALSHGRWEEGMRLLDVLRPIEDYRSRAGGSYNISFLKYALQATGLNFGPPRPPGRRLTSAEQQEIDLLLKPIWAAEEELASAAQLQV